MAGDVELKVDRELISTILEAKITAAIVSEIGGHKALIEGIVQNVLNARVTRNGKVSNYSSENKYPLIEAMAIRAIERSAKAAVESWVEAQQPSIQKALEAQLKRKTGSLAKAMADGLQNALDNSWRLNVTCAFETQK